MQTVAIPTSVPIGRVRDLKKSLTKPANGTGRSAALRRFMHKRVTHLMRRQIRGELDIYGTPLDLSGVHPEPYVPAPATVVTLPGSCESTLGAGTEGSFDGYVPLIWMGDEDSCPEVALAGAALPVDCGTGNQNKATPAGDCNTGRGLDYDR